MLLSTALSFTSLLLASASAFPTDLFSRSFPNPIKNGSEFAFGEGPGIFKAGFDKLVAFGDSLTDDGNAFKLTNGVLPPAEFYKNNSFSNGPVYSALLSERLAVPLHNFAVAGSTTNNDRAPSILNAVQLRVPSTLEQIDSYLADPAAKDRIHTSLHIVFSGGNDPSGGTLVTGVDTANDIAKGVHKLREAGANHILIFTLQDLSVNFPPVTANPELSAFLGAFTLSLQQTLFEIFDQDKYHPFTAITDLFTIGRLVQDNAEQFGFNPDFLGVECLMGVSVEGVAPVVTLCENERERFWFDTIHPTTRVHSLIAAAAIATLKNKGWVW